MNFFAFSSLKTEIVSIPLHDIIPPFPISDFIWWIIGGCIAFLIVTSICYLVYRVKFRCLTPIEKAHNQLLALKKQLMDGSDDQFGEKVSMIIRVFLNASLNISILFQTTEDFLKSLNHLDYFSEETKVILTEFLHHVDYLKYAQGKTTEEQRVKLLEVAEILIKKTDEKINIHSK